MSNLEFFKKQSKKLLKDWQTQTKTIKSDGSISYNYDWKFYDVNKLFNYFKFDDKDRQTIKLARAQHIIAKIVGFKKWNELILASEKELESAELILRKFKTTQDIHELTTEPTNYLNFLKETFPDKQTRKMFEFFIASILAHDDKPRKAAFFIGDGATGKSTMIEVLRTVFKNMIGGYLTARTPNISCWDDSYLNTWAMVGDHVEYKISGKFFDIFTRTPSREGKPCYARMIIQGNFMPFITGDKARYDSALVIPFEHQIKREDYFDSKKFFKKIEEEAPSIIMRYEKLYIELRDKLNGIIPESELSKLRKKEYIALRKKLYKEEKDFF